MAVGGEVEGRLLEVRPADHRAYRGGVVVEHHDRRGRLDAGEPARDDRLHLALEVEVEGRGDLEAAAEGLAGAVAIDELLAQPRGEVRGERVLLRRRDVVLARELERRVLRVLLVGQIALLGHPLEHEVAPLQRRPGVGSRGVGARRGDHPGQERGLPRQELRGTGLGVVTLAAAGVRRAEVGARRGLDPGRALAEVDLVQVLGEDLVLRPLPLEVVCDRRLAELLQDRAAVLRGERVLDELLRDRRGALLGRAGEDVLIERPADPLEVDAAMLVEALVLDGDHRLLDDRRDLLGGEQDAALVVGQGGEALAADVVDDRVLGALVLLAALERRQVLGDGHHDPEDPGDEREPGEAQQDEGEAELSQPGLLPALGLLGGTRRLGQPGTSPPAPPDRRRWSSRVRVRIRNPSQQGLASGASSTTPASRRAPRRGLPSAGRPLFEGPIRPRGRMRTPPQSRPVSLALARWGPCRHRRTRTRPICSPG